MKVWLIPLLISLTACQSGISVNQRHQHTGSIVDVGVNLTRDWYYTVPQESMREHQRCVDFALREMRRGEECKWQTNQAVGIVKVAKIESSGCHLLLNTVYYKNKPKYFQENYCVNSTNTKWYRTP